MKVGLDLDNTVFASAEAEIDIARELYGIEIPLADMMRGRSALVPRWLTYVQFRRVQRLFNRVRERTLATRPLPGAFEYIGRLHADGHNLEVITARTEAKLRHAVELWKLHRLPDVPFTGTGRGLPKIDATAHLEVYVDDSAKVLAELAVHRHLLRIHFARPGSGATPEGAIRAESWEQVYQIISQHQPQGGGRNT